MANIFTFLANPMIFMPIFGIVIGLVIWFYIKDFREPVTERKAIINELTEKIKSYGENDYFFAELNENLEQCKSDIVINLWKKYKRNFITITDDEDITHVYTTIDADEYFNLHDVGADLSLDFWQNLSGVFTGLGILGTFLGLTFGLSGIDMSSNAGIQRGIANLLNGTSTAFLTSIIGIIIALIFNYFYSTRLIKNFALSVDNLASELNRLIPQKNAEELLYINSEAVKEQTTQLDDFNTKLALTIGESLHNAMMADVKPVLDKLLEAITNLSKDGTKAISDSINTHAGEELRSFANTLQTLQENMQEMLNQSQQMNEENNQKLRTTVDEMVKNLKEATSDSVIEQQKHMNEMMEQMKDGFTELNDNLQQTIQRLLDAGTITSTELGKNIEQVANRLNEIVKKWEDMSIRGQKESADNIEQITQKLQAAMDEMTKTLQNATAASAKGQSEHANELNEQMKNLFAELNDSLRKTVQELSAASSEIGKALGQGMEHVGNTSDEIIKKWENIFQKQQEESANNIKKIQTILEQTESAMRQDREKYSVMWQMVNKELQNTMKTSDALIQQAGTTADQFAEAAEPINTVAQTMGNSVHEVLNATKDFNSNVSTAVLALKNTSAENVRSVTTIRESLERTEKSWHAYENVFQGLDEALGKTFAELEKNLVQYNQLTQGGLSDNLAAFDSSIRGAITQVGSLVEELQDTIEMLQVKTNNRK